ncbi:FAD-dependent oxidoreductase [Mycobacterium sp. 21AC1]|uniref:FAD-dependent oxidoreductase n=1 Tax=[Mycobacterium] appelbergii TaxID=2939269 RepID=UPI0029392CE1|nr:FAD-dependent oxidoreductase [Mycobacterium sp. 21AC1]MDV3130302.1 FAD-dependent oxidoreductase [Mycobacterium sp. 21AC1]
MTRLKGRIIHDVIVVGAGPVGLFAAQELALAGCSVLVLERDREPTSPWKTLPLGLRGLNAGSVQTLDRRGLLAAVAEASHIDVATLGAPHDAVDAPAPRDVSHFAGMGLDAHLIDTAALGYRLPSPAAEGFMTSLDAFSSALCKRLAELGVDVIRGASVTAVSQDDECVVAQAADREYRARWLVGCDGGRSAVRALADFDFVGSGPTFTGYVAHVSFADAQRLPYGFNVTSNGMYLRTPLEGHVGMMDFDGGAFDRSQPLTCGHLESVLRRVSGADVSIREVHLASSFTDRAMQTSSYRSGRVLLAGDAAHIHSPLGGQGLNLGIGDALNLGWKLAATVHGYATDELLDTYGAERHPVGADVLDWSRAQVAAMKPAANTPALRKLLLAVMNTPCGATHVYRTTSGLFHHYDLGGGHPIVGTSAPDFQLADGRRLGDLIRGGRGIVLDVHGQTLRNAVNGWEGRIDYRPGPVRDDLGFHSLLIRPDGIVAWASGGDPDTEVFLQTATRWFGLPSGHGVG